MRKGFAFPWGLFPDQPFPPGWKAEPSSRAEEGGGAWPESQRLSAQLCRQAQPTLKDLLAKYKGRVSLAYRDFPLREIHAQGQLAAEASRCAGEQGKFWEYHDLLFANPDRLNRDGLVEHARDLKLDEKQFDSCLSSGKYKAEIEEDLQEGIRAGVSGTPGFFINGSFLSGMQPEAAFEGMIQAEMGVPKEKRAAQ